MARVRSFYKKWSHLNGLGIGTIKFEKFQASIFGDRR